MPVYEFNCKNCSHIFDGLYPSGTKAENLECPECKQKTLVRKFSTFAVSSKIGDFASASGSSSKSKCSSCGGGSCSTCS
ncbi:MAG: zinc ribbon domain-containing protein [Candidatus Eremiobacterota bacterium]